MSEYTTEFIRNTTDKSILAEILRRGKNDFVSYIAARNSNCPPEVLAEVLRRGKRDGVSYWAANNPVYKTYIIKLKEEEKLQAERLNNKIKRSVNNLFYGIMIDE